MRFFQKTSNSKWLFGSQEPILAEDVVAFAESQGIRARPDQVGLGGICLLVPQD